MSITNEKFVDLGSPRRVWAVAAINGDLERLGTLHDHLATRFAIRDRLVYLGNYLGAKSTNNREVVEEMLAFRTALLAKPGMKTSDIVHLRGPAEEAWQRLLRLQFAPSPMRAMEKLQEAGVEAYLRLYNVSLNDTKVIAKAGSIAITRWTNQLRDIQRKVPGHDALVSSTRRAAFTSATEEHPEKVLFVPAGFDETKTLEEQGEALWGEGPASFASNSGNFSKVIRGFDPEKMGINTEGKAITLDGGCGRGGPLVCGCFDANGNVLEIVTVGGRGAVEEMRRETPSHSFKTPTVSPSTDYSHGHWDMHYSASV